MRVITASPITIADLTALATTSYSRETIRQLRAPLLAAFDVYKSNVAYGIVTETNAEHKEIAKWYRLLLDLDPVAIREVPTLVAQYVKEGVIA